MKFYFISLFPEIFPSVLQSSIVGRALLSKSFEYEVVNPRDFSSDSHKSVDDHPYGGGPGMVMRADILESALLFAFKAEGIDPHLYDKKEYAVIVTSASARAYTQDDAKMFSSYKAIFIVCGHYEGIDQRFIDQYADHVVRVGDYVLTGGELPAMTIADSVIRLLPGVLGSDESAGEESFSFSDASGVLLEYPQYTRPALFNGKSVPDQLLSGNHSHIKAWRLQKSQELRSQFLKPKQMTPAEQLE